MLTFLGLGAQKAGTTWLYTMLSRHPDVSFPYGKELHYWDKGFQGVDAGSYINAFNRDDNCCEGEITPSYAQLPLNTIKFIHREFPNLKLILIVRNPIERAWSAALMALRRAQMDIGEASDQWFIDVFNSKASLQRGDYEACIKNWRSVFPSEQLLILDYEEVVLDPVGLLKKCCNHIGVRSYSEDEVSSLGYSEKIFAGNNFPMRLSVKKHLLGIYSEKIESFSNYMSKDYCHWLEN